MIWYVARAADGTISARYAYRVKGVAEEALDDAAPDNQTFAAKFLPAPAPMLDANTLAAALVSKGVLANADITTALQSHSGSTLAGNLGLANAGVAT